MVRDDEDRRICFSFPKDTSFSRVHGIKAVPEIYWHTHEQYFSIHGLYHFRCFVRFNVTSRVSPRQEDYGKPSEETTSMILACEFTSGQNLRISLYAETGLQNSPMPKGFIDPFLEIEKYGTLGDPFSLSVLSPGERQDREVSMMHRNHRHNYAVSASLAPTQSLLFQITIDVNPADDYHPDYRPDYRPGLAPVVPGRDWEIRDRIMASVAPGRGQAVASVAPARDEEYFR